MYYIKFKDVNFYVKGFHLVILLSIHLLAATYMSLIGFISYKHFDLYNFFNPDKKHKTIRDFLFLT